MAATGRWPSAAAAAGSRGVRRVLRGVRHRVRQRWGPPTILNRAVDLERGVVFISIPKNGTTSVRRQLRQRGAPLIPNPHLDIVQVRDAMYTLALCAALGRNRTYPNPDAPTDADVRAQASATFAGLFKFAAVRNPWARAVSLWSRRRTRDMPFERFLEHHVNASDNCVNPTRHRCQLDWLCDEHGAVVMDYVYKLEEFAQATEEIAALTDGRVALAPLRLNVNRRSPAARYRELYTPRTRELVARRFARDIDHFGYTF